MAWSGFENIFGLSFMNYIDFITDIRLGFYHRYENYDIVELPCSGFAPNFKLRIPLEHGIALKEVAAKLPTNEQYSMLTGLDN